MRIVVGRIALLCLVTSSTWMGGGATADTPVAATANQSFPAPVELALKSANSVTLYSLEPTARRKEPVLYGWHVLGSVRLIGSDAATAIGVFREAVANPGDIMTGCFEPREALRITTQTHTYDFLLCVSCMKLLAYEDGKEISDLTAYGTRAQLKRLLIVAHVPVSNTDDAEQQESEQRWTASLNNQTRWIAAMPDALRPIWSNTEFGGTGQADPNPFRSALELAVPDAGQRILAILGWFGSGAGQWSGYPAYEDVAEKMLLDYPTRDIVAAMQRSTLTDVQLDGAARFFASFDFRRLRPNDLQLLPSELKERLLERVSFVARSRSWADRDKTARAKAAFANQ